MDFSWFKKNKDVTKEIVMKVLTNFRFENNVFTYDIEEQIIKIVYVNYTAKDLENAYKDPSDKRKQNILSQEIAAENEVAADILMEHVKKKLFLNYNADDILSQAVVNGKEPAATLAKDIIMEYTLSLNDSAKNILSQAVAEGKEPAATLAADILMEYKRYLNDNAKNILSQAVADGKEPAATLAADILMELSLNDSAKNILSQAAKDGNENAKAILLVINNKRQKNIAAEQEELAAKQEKLNTELVELQKDAKSLQPSPSDEEIEKAIENNNKTKSIPSNEKGDRTR